MILAKKVRLHPTPLQEQKLWQSAGVSRWAYNFALDIKQKTYKETGKAINEGNIRKLITQMKQTEEYSWLKEVSAQVPKQAVKDLDMAYTRFFKGLGDKPKFKSRKKSKKSFYNANDKLKVRENKLVNIEKVGWIKTNEQIPIGVKYSNPRVSFDNKYWYLSVGIEIEEKQEQLTDVSLGIDLGVSELAICSDGTRYKNINKTRRVRKLEKKLRMLQRKVSKKYLINKEGGKFVKTSNIIKLEKKIQLLHRKIANIRKNYLHQVTTKIVKIKPFRVVIEDLNVKGMMKNRHLSKAIAKQGFYEFRRMLEYKCKFKGIELILADRFFPSSKMCSKCGVIDKGLKLSDRVYKCNCGLSIDRDFNASINLSNYKLA